MADDHGKGDEGSGLPAVLDAGAKVADTGIMKDLLGRTFKAAGDYLGDISEDYFKKLREQRRKNIKDHETRVAEVIGEDVDVLSKPSRHQAVRRWVELAADVPVADAERAAISEAVLVEIVTTDSTPEYQDVAERLTTSDTRLLLSAPVEAIAPDVGDRRGFENLRSLGLASRLDLRQALRLVTYWLLGTILGGAALLGTIWYLRRALALEIFAATVAFSLLILVFGITLIATKYSLTEFGRSLQRSALRFYPKREKVRKAWLLSAVPSSPLVWGVAAALLVSVLPFALQSYLPFQEPIRTVIISAPPANPNPSPPAPTPPSNTGSAPQQTMLTADEIGTLIDVWRSVSGQMNEIIDLTNAGLALIPNWPQRVKSDAVAFSRELIRQRDSINQQRISLQSLNTAYQRYPNVGLALVEVTRDDVFGRLSRALDSFSRETQGLAVPPPESFEGKLRPYAGELKRALDAMARWANETRNFAARQGQELSNAKIQ